MFPVWMRLKIRPARKRGVSLWFPVILVWVILWALMLILLPFALLAALVTLRRGPGLALLAAYPLLFAVLWNLSGLHIEARDAESDVLVSFR
jgi:hypothetical protein